MKLKLIVAILGIAAIPAGAQSQTPSAGKVTKADAQKVVEMISGDKVKTETYCDIAKLGVQIDEADAKKDTKKADELNQKMVELTTKLGPEYIALMDRIQEIDPNSQDMQEIGSVLTEGARKLCVK